VSRASTTVKTHTSPRSPTTATSRPSGSTYEWGVRPRFALAA